jgi:hypothetical protein
MINPAEQILDRGWLQQILDRRWWYGGPRDFWIKNGGLIKDMVGRMKLAPVPPDQLGIEVQMEKSLRIPIPPFPGGLKTPHLHLGRDVYVLSQDQWKDFSTRVVKDFQVKLEKAQSLNFQQLMNVADVMEGF